MLAVGRTTPAPAVPGEDRPHMVNLPAGTGEEVTR
jgi:hypothetical protein